MSEPQEVTLDSIAKKLELTEEEKNAVNSLVLLNPEMMKAQYATSKELATEGENYAKEGNKAVAGNRFESAAKLALFERNVPGSRKFLEKAVELGRGSPFDVALKSFDKIASCVEDYYKNNSR